MRISDWSSDVCSSDRAAGTPASAEAFDRIGDAALPGGTTTLLLDPDTLTVEKQYLSLVGTIRNCAGGVTPWNSWLSCEENVDGPSEGVGRDHGWVFDVPADADGPLGRAHVCTLVTNAHLVCRLLLAKK